MAEPIFKPKKIKTDEVVSEFDTEKLIQKDFPGEKK